MDLKESGRVLNRHPWEIARANSIYGIIKNYIPDNNVTIADIGSGDLYFTRKISSMHDCTIYAVDTGYDVQEQNGKIIQYNDIILLKENSIDILIMMDVLEHVENVYDFLSVLTKKVKTNGIIVITVPAWQHLFSEHDLFLKHFRRYNKKLLKADLSFYGFKITKLFYFYFPLYLIRNIQKFILEPFYKKNIVNNISIWEYKSTSAITRLIVNILEIDFKINLHFAGKCSLPGLSLFALCRRIGD